VKGKIAVDLIDPHSSDWPDAVFKARGLAEYAQKHGDHFGRIEMVGKDKKNELKRLNLSDEVVREKVKKVSSKEHLDLLFEEA
jgi:type III restriction enzyme